ncbi:CRYG [Lepeophtheirus salmonis]|uniref:CRYG n=1 Tax=Lepeophtheirus salmonis TaxID=72036 RepID=A0A7R8D5Z2_LEPSM|nr:CRYG [Lepeophtheirus salmonis]CAF3009387.1 CRYG [Lepeophtheirus salmonis]
MKTLFVTLLFIGLSLGIPRQSKEAISSSARLYSEPGFHGRSTEIRDYVEDLDTLNFDDVSQSAVINGVWVFYEDVDYNKYNFGRRSFYGWGKNHQIPSFGRLNRAFSSVRYSGANENMKYNTLNLYEESGFMGDEKYFYSDTPSLYHDNFWKIHHSYWMPAMDFI